MKHNSYISNFKNDTAKKNVKLFAKLLIILAALIVFASVVVGEQYQESYQAALKDKVDRIEHINEPKIVLIGNSNLAFGIQSELLEEEFGMPVVNLGLHGSTGHPIIEEVAKLNVNPGDIYICCYTTYADFDSYNDPSLVWSAIEYDLYYWKLIRLKDIPVMVEAYPTYFRKATELWSGKVLDRGITYHYSRASFNEYGDECMERKDNLYQFTYGSVLLPSINDTCCNRLNELNDYITKRGAVLLAAGYPIGEGEFTPSKSEYDNIQEKIEKKLNFPMISRFTDYFQPYENFFDTNAHLTNEGAKLRTQQLIIDLNNYLNGSETK